MAAAPPDPYRGLAGLEAAWARFRSWLLEDLPRQWDEIAYLLGLLGDSGPPPTGGPPPPPPGPSGLPPNGVYNVPARFMLSALSPEDQAKALQYVEEWPIAYSVGTIPRFARVEAENAGPGAVALGILGWVGVEIQELFGAWIYVMPWGENTVRFPGRAIWIPGASLLYPTLGNT